MKTSATGIALIKRFEGIRLDAYQDIVGVWTIGYGSTKGVREGMQITQQEAEDMLATRLATEFEPAVQKTIGEAPTTQNQWDAMVSLAWNIGPEAFLDHCSVPRHHREGDYVAAANSFALWNKAGGQVVPALAKRRAEEARVYRGNASTTDFGDYKCAKAMQQALQAAGLYKGVIDGKWGPASRAAYDAFNRSV